MRVTAVTLEPVAQWNWAAVGLGTTASALGNFATLIRSNPSSFQAE